MIHFKHLFQKIHDVLPPTIRHYCECLKLRIKFDSTKNVANAKKHLSTSASSPSNWNPSDYFNIQTDHAACTVVNEKTQTNQHTAGRKELGITLYVGTVAIPPGIIQMRHYLNTCSLTKDPILYHDQP